MVRTLLAKVATLEAEQGDITGSKTTSRTTAHHATPQGEDAEALRKRVIAAKVDRINNYGRNPVIGRARM
jgi:hypothetical protein